MKKIVCVQCWSELSPRQFVGGSLTLYYCNKPKCPNYEIFQVGVEEEKQLKK
mgnify:FL=1